LTSSAGRVVVVALLASCGSKPLQEMGATGGVGGIALDAGQGTPDAGPGWLDVGPGWLDAAPDLPSDSGWPTGGRRSFLVTSLLQRDGGFGSAPTSHMFTLVLDMDRRTAIAGGPLEADVATLEPTGPGEVRVFGSLSFTLAGGCSGSSITYTDIRLFIDASDRLAGQGRGQLYIQTGDVGETVAATMLLTGGADTQPPTLALSAGGDPFAPFYLLASEPLPPSATAVARAADGETIALVPGGTAGSAIALFQKPTMLLRYATRYQIGAEGVTDFAGNAATGVGLSFTTGPLPPLAAEDGFESLTDTTFAGVQVLSAGDGPVIAGTKSLYIPPAAGTPPSQPTMTIRVPVSAGDRFLRFSYRTVTSSVPVVPGDAWALGSEGGELTTAPSLSEPASAMTPGMIGTTPVTLGQIGTASLPLDSTAAGEVVLQRTLQVAYGGCGPPRPLAVRGVIIDDLRAE
jgi:hypothetical protein